MKPTLNSIRSKTNVTMQALAQRAGLSPAEVFVVEIGGYTSVEKVQQVIAAFNQLSGMRITVHEIAFHAGGGQ